MKLFEQNWISDKWVDFEYKKYTLLGYLQKVNSLFIQNRIYPYLSLLRNEQNDLKLILNKLTPEMPDDFRRLVLNEQPRLAEDDRLEVLREIIVWALPHIDSKILEGQEIEALVKSEMTLSPVGLLPFKPREGFLIFRQPSEARIYRYELLRVTPGKDDEIHSSHLKTWYHSTLSASPFITLNDIKYQLIRKQKELPNPATFAIHCGFTLSYPETLVPIGRKMLFETLAATYNAPRAL